MDDWDEIFKGPHWNLLANGEWATANFKPWVGILATSVGYHDFSTGLRSAPTKNLQIYVSFSCYLIFSFMCMFSRSLFVLLYFFFWSLSCLFFFDLQILITSLWYLQTLLLSSTSIYHLCLFTFIKVFMLCICVLCI